VMLIHFSIQVT